MPGHRHRRGRETYVVRLRYVPDSPCPLPCGVAAIVGTAEPSIPLNVRIPKPLLAWLDREALRLGCTRAALIRALLGVGLDRLQQEGQL